MQPSSPAIDGLLLLAAILQGAAVVYGCVLLRRRRGAAGAWLFLLGAMLSMLAWRIVVVTRVHPPDFFNPTIAIWGSTCMVIAMFLFGREVARRERAEHQRDALLASEREARQKAEQASRLKDQFLATLSHELRTPLTAILSWCAIVRMRHDDPADVRHGIDTIERSARVQGRLIEDLLDATRMQAGRLHLERSVVDLAAPVAAAIESLQPVAAQKNVTIELTQSDAPTWIDADPGRIQQAAANLIGNAVKFSATGGHVRVRVCDDGESAELAVEDDGEGIPAAFLPHVFERFRQYDSTVRRRHGGLGLGLAIVANLVELHGGTVQAYSEGSGRGARFVVRLPRCAASPATALPAESELASPPPATPDLRGLRVLVIDDEADVRSGLARLLENAGAEVATLESGAGAEHAIAQHRPHALLIDIGMPGEDGYSLIRRIRALPTASGGALPAISLTAHARSEDRARALASGFQNHLPKPIDFPVLVETIRTLVARDLAATRTSARPVQPPSA
ncbi:response regulator [Candidatus Binatia bacterium]|nr:response regulator [Candidatus Binatia bacterium]